MKWPANAESCRQNLLRLFSLFLSVWSGQVKADPWKWREVGWRVTREV